MEDLESKFRDHVLKVQEYSSLRLSEADTRAYLIDPLLHILGYSGVRNLRREVTVPATKEALDYQLLVDGLPQAIVEAKALRHNLTEQHAAQCVQYASVLGVRWCLITNGLTWAVYDSHAKTPLAGKQVARVRLDGDDSLVSEAWTVLSAFSQDSLAKASPVTNLLIDRVVSDELTSPDSTAIAALKRVVSSRFGERVSGQAVVDAIGRLIDKVALNSIKDEGKTEPVEHQGKVANDSKSIPSATPSQNSDNMLKRQVRGEGRKRTSIGDLVRAGLLPHDATLTASVRGITHMARLRNDQLEINGRTYSSASAASQAVRNVRSWNGWLDWHYKGESLYDLRERLGADQQAQLDIS